MINLDPWQRDFINEKGDKVLVSGRQTGKSEAAAYDNAEFVINNSNKTCLIISRTERQAHELLMKTLNIIHALKPKIILNTVKDKVTQSRIPLSNNSQVLSLPTGLAGEGIRYLTAHKITADEAQLIPDDVFTAVTPMLLTTGGSLSLLGTPQGKKGFFWNAYENKFNNFKVFHINSEKVVKERAVGGEWNEQRRESALIHLKKERQRMSAKQYAQEYLGEFVEDLTQYFSDELIKKCCILKRQLGINENLFLGVDIARMGGDEITFEIIKRFTDTNFQHRESIIKKEQLTTDTERDIIGLDLIYNFDKIGIDAGAGSLGVGIFDRLMENNKIKRKIVAMNNRTISMDRDGKKKQRIFKEDMYENMLSMMERGELLLLDDDEITASLKSIQWEIIELKPNSPSRIRIFGNYSHIAEGLVRACWLAKKEKLNKVRISYF